MAEEIRLSPQQRRLWRAGEADGTVPRARCEMLADGPLDESREEALRAVLQGLVDRHEILRTTFQSRPWLKVPVQVIADAGTFGWRKLDLAALPEEERAAALVRLRHEEAPVLDLERGPVLHAALARLAPDRHALVLDLPALCCDLRSLANLAGEIRRDFAAASPASSPAVQDDPLQYADFSEWQHELLEGAERSAEAGKAYWARQDLAAARSLRLPYEREAGSGFAPATVAVDLGPDLPARLAGLARTAQVPPATVLLTAWMALLWRLAPQPEVVVGRLFDGRTYDDLHSGVGLFARSLPVRGLLNPRLRFRDGLAQVQAAEREAGEWQHYFDAEEGLKLAGGDVVSPFGFEHEEAGPTLQGPFRLARREAWTERFTAKLSCFEGDGSGSFVAELGFDPVALDPQDARRLGRQLRSLLEAVTASPDALLGEIDILPEEDRAQLAALNDTAVDVPPARCFHHLFAEQAARTPRLPAVACEDRELTYAELNAQANRLARHLRSLGVGPDVRVAILAERSVEMVVSLLGVLKAGGAYVPLDPAYPGERLAMMLADCGAAVVVGQDTLLEAVPAGGVTAGVAGAAGALRVRLTGDAGEIDRQADSDPADGAVPENLAYVLFTSGSTGRPKGVAVEHRQVFHYLQAILRELRPAAGEGFALVSTFSADLGNTMVFPALATGGCLHVLAEDRVSDPEALTEAFARRPADFLKIVPSHLAALAEAGLDRLLPRRVLVIGGEAASPELIRLLGASPTAVLNHYGPTETTVGATTCRLEPDKPSLPLGRPLANTRVYLLDPFGRPVPAGIPGEAYIGGGGVTRGYLGRPDVTAERFVPDAFSGEPGARLYRTGDLVRLLPGAAEPRLEFLGRADHQVKIRGFRIELGEIESVLAEHPSVREALVLARDGRAGERRLAGFAVLQRGMKTDAAELAAWLRQRLPEAMVPPSLTVLAALPLTPNGKVDRQALLQLEADAGAALSRGAGQVAPRKPAEAALAGIWAEVLGLESVGVFDNFFELGGDSILVIQVIARAHKVGLRFNPRQLFQHQTVAELAEVAGALPEIHSEQGAVTGEVPLTPIQRWFFGLGLSRPSHWNQSVLLEPQAEVDPARVAAALEALLRHHDALRLRFRRDGGEWRQEIAAPGASVPFERHDLSGLPAPERDQAFREALARAEAGLDIENGPLLRAAWVDLGPELGVRLLLAVHHLAVDGVSWRLLLEDLSTALSQLAEGGEVDLPAKTTDFKHWAERLVEHVRSGALDGEIPHWLEASAAGGPLPLDRPAEQGENDAASARIVSVDLDAGATGRLLREAPAVCRAQMNELLLSALLRAFAGWTGAGSLWLDLEGHGREPLFDDVDLSRTVGWFTTHFPVHLSAPEGAGAEEALRAVKRRLREVPGRGIGHGLLRYFGPPEVAAGLAAQPPVSFNYLGQFDGAFAQSSFRRAAEPTGPTHAADARRAYLLQVVCLVLDGRLQVDWHFSANRHDRATVERLADGFLRALRELIDQVAESEAMSWIASDFPLANIDQPTLDRLLLEKRALEDLYPLSPIQQGLLFHSLYEPGTGLYIGQLDCVLAGELDLDAFEAAWRQVVERHPIFRTAFVWEGLDQPLQLVFPHVELPVERHDWSALSEEDRQLLLDAWLTADREAGYDLGQPPLMRIAFCRLGPASHKMLWSHHHLLLDGWSLALLAQDLFGVYAALRSGRPAEPSPARPYRDYVEWLQARDLEPARAFWQDALRGFTAPSTVESIHAARTGGERQGLEDQWLTLPEEPTAALQEWLRGNQLTLNTLVQGVWAVLLSHYSGKEDVLFGATVAGRPVDLAGFEWMIGLFINTLPVRALVSPEAELPAWLADLQSRQVEAREFEDTPLVEIQGWSELPRGVALFDSVLVVENYPTGDSPERGFELVDMRYSMKENFPLIFTVMPGRELRIKIKYESSLFSRPAIDRMASFFLAVLSRIAAGPQVRLADLLAVLEETGRQRQSQEGQKLKDLRVQKFEQLKRKAVGTP